MPGTASDSQEKRPCLVSLPVPCFDPSEDCEIGRTEIFESLPPDMREAILEANMENYLTNGGY